MRLFKASSARLAAATAGLLIASTLTPSAATAGGPRQPDVPPGLSVVDVAERPVPDPLPHDLAYALDDAITLTEGAPDDLGYAWVDRATNTLMIDAATPAGEVAVRGFVPPRGAGVRPAVRRVAFSRARLQAIQDEAIRLTSADIPDGELVYETGPDRQANRIVIRIERRSNALMRGLAARYGTRAIAVEVGGTRGSPSANRQSDISPYYGGAYMEMPGGGGCTSGFPWQIDSTKTGIVTAGHCVPHGGHVASATQWMGWVTSGSGENWTPGTGTVLMPGQAYPRGDVALIVLESPWTAGYSIYRGGPTSSTSTMVRGMWDRRAQYGDQYCTGGSVSGELCGWKVVEEGYYHRYANGELLRPGVKGSKLGACARKGDSGGPVFTVMASGYIDAKGIHSGDGGGGTDHYGGSLDPCYEWFTDIWDAFWGLPGQPRVG